MTTTALEVRLDDDPTPLVYAIGHRLRLSMRDPAIVAIAETFALRGLRVVVIADGTPATATISFADGTIGVQHAQISAPDLTVHVDVASPYAVTSCAPEEVGDDVAFGVSRLLNPVVSDWTEAAREFWELTSRDVGMPGRLIAMCDDGQKVVLGDGPVEYELHGSATNLGRVFAGLDSLFEQVLGGALYMRGTMPQLSVMAGASWKVQFHG
ncbi:hypothetical protein H7J87_21040 [Mycolicibacterium wolinskyi]|uniref:Uncharacterized protein n=1 Tax=Mycolicibacterium wolinskyi TaxID=59750 RepID=A0A1X2F223_9MYCO|nr:MULTISPECIES: hypothetical protein [Mycolicibacterium]MCV7287813.1 hypothetical protein [Mycolicibacterium wolinskyi]MCV7294711.1 hypothetical protein [Mycolicibacterium goodii]ORX12428.1 hypothetical protein AWC31_31055 [Mycolicibacterium wolinskyi]